MSQIKFLSYPLNDKAHGYGNGERFQITQVRDMCCGDTSNNTVFKMPTHYGTHIDFPYHFSSSGKKSSNYKASDFIFNKSVCIEINPNEVEEYLISIDNLSSVIENVDEGTELLFVKTGFCDKRNTNEYWEFGFGFHPDTAFYLKSKFPKLKAIAFDLISMNSYQQREIGREAHKQFLIEHEILIVEEVDLRSVNSSTQFVEVILSPLLLENADGAPITIIAKTL